MAQRTVPPSAHPKKARAGEARTRPSSESERTRRRMLRIATKLFAERGFHGVSVDDVATAAGLSKRLPYYYFRSKKGLYRAVIMEVYQRIEGMEFQVVDAAISPSEKLTALLKGYFVFLRENPEFTQLLQRGNLEKGRYFPKGLLSKMPLVRRLREIVEEGVNMGEFRADLDIPHLLINVIGLAFIYFSNQYSLSQVLELDLDSPRQRERAMKQLQAVLLDGIRAHGPKQSVTTPA